MSESAVAQHYIIHKERCHGLSRFVRSDALTMLRATHD
jgi:hypothetical protein